MPLPIPYVQTFFEYPIVTAFFAYVMGSLGSLMPGQLLINYYLLSCAFLLIPTLLLIREMRLIVSIKGLKETNLLWFFVVTPTFLLVLLANWYVIGTYFSIAGIRYFLQGKRKTSGLLLGLSAVSNLVTAAPALGLLLSEKRVRDALIFAAAGLVTFAALNLPVYLLNPTNWLGFWNYQYSWYIEDSWMLLFLSSESPLRHIIPLVVFSCAVLALLFVRFRLKLSDPLTLSFLGTFAFVFSTYVYTPQMNVLLLPFFVLVPALSVYPEFLIFDALNAFIILGFSQGLPYFLALFGIIYNLSPWGLTSPVQLAGIVRSIWLGKFTAYNGYYRGGRAPERDRKVMENKNIRERLSLETDRVPTEGDSWESYSSASSLEAGASAIPPEAEDPSTT